MKGFFIVAMYLTLALLFIPGTVTPVLNTLLTAKTGY